jgi:hypothetical protein
MKKSPTQHPTTPSIRVTKKRISHFALNAMALRGEVSFPSDTYREKTQKFNVAHYCVKSLEAACRSHGISVPGNNDEERCKKMRRALLIKRPDLYFYVSRYYSNIVGPRKKNRGI